MAVSAAQRKREQRERDKLTESERLSRLLSRTIKLELYKRTDLALIRCLDRLGLDEPQDLISRLIHNADLLQQPELERMTALPSRENVTN